MDFNNYLWKQLATWRDKGEINSKLYQKKWLKEHGFKTAKLYKIVTLENIKDSDLPNECALKNSTGASSIGVMVLQRQDGNFFEKRTGKSLTFNRVKQIMQHAEAQKPYWSKEWLIEEMLEPKPGELVPHECKCFVIGEVQIFAVHTKQRGRQVKQWYDKHLNVIDVGRSYDTIDPNLKPPKDTPELFRMCREIFKGFDYPFMRIDIFDTAKGFYVGEINYTEGVPTFNKKWNDYLSKKLEEQICQNSIS